MNPHRRRVDPTAAAGPFPDGSDDPAAPPTCDEATAASGPNPDTGPLSVCSSPLGLSGRELTDLVRAQVGARRPGEVVGLMRGHLDAADDIADAFGLEQSELLLDDLVDRIRGVLRGGDIVERCGHHGWVAIIRGLPGWRDLELVAERSLRAARLRVALGEDLEHLVTTSIGLAAASDSLASAIEVVGQAERAAARVRLGGGDRFAFGHRENRPGLARLEMARDLRLAVAADQLELSYQMVRRVDSGVGAVAAPTRDQGLASLVGFDRQPPKSDPDGERFEVLVRWRHPVRGAQRPVSFLPAVIAAGLGLPFTELLLTRVCRAAIDASVRSGRLTTMAVDLDLGLIDLPGEDCELPELVAQVLARHGLPSAQLALEFDLGQLARASDMLAGALSRLALMGVRLSADQVEPSLTSSRLLQAWPVLGEWKLDRSVAEALDADRGVDPARAGLARAGVEALVAAAAERRVEVTALGVEGAEAAEILKDLGVQQLQGPYIQRSQRPPL